MTARNPNTVVSWVRCLNVEYGVSFGRMAQIEPFKGIPRGTLGAIAAGIPIPNDYCPQLGLSPIVKVPADMVRKNKKRTNSQPRHRKAVNLDDPKSAARSIVNSNATDEYIEKLAQVLTAYVAPVEGELKY